MNNNYYIIEGNGGKGVRMETNVSVTFRQIFFNYKNRYKILNNNNIFKLKIVCTQFRGVVLSLETRGCRTLE